MANRLVASKNETFDKIVFVKHKINYYRKCPFRPNWSFQRKVKTNVENECDNVFLDFGERTLLEGGKGISDFMTRVVCPSIHQNKINYIMCYVIIGSTFKMSESTFLSD